MKLLIPIKPVAKGRPRTRVVRTGKKVFATFYTDSKTRQFEEAVYSYCVANKINITKDVPLEIYIEFNFIKPKSSKNIYHIVKPDIDNLCKSLLDGMKIKDENVVFLSARKYYEKVESIYIEIKEII